MRVSRDRGHDPRLLQRARYHPRYVQAAARPLQGLYQHTEAEYVPERAHDGHRLGGHPVRGADPHVGDAHDGGIRRRGALEIQDRQRRGHQGRRRGEVRVDPPPARDAAGVRRAGLFPQPEGGHVRRRGVRVLAEGRRDQPARRRDADRLCLQHPLRDRQQHGRRNGQRPHRELRLCAAKRRHCRHPHVEKRARSEPRLAQSRQERRRAHKDQAVVQARAPRGEHHPRQGAV